MHEIITIQLGQRANYLATHYWNAQESYQTFAPTPSSPVDHDVSFRPGIGADGTETYMPRTLIYDLKGGFGSLRRVNELYELEAEQAGLGVVKGVWNGPTSIIQTPAIPASPYIQSLNANLPSPRLSTSTVKYWSDFSHLFYHPRSIVQLNDYSLGSSLQPFESYTSGDELFDSLDTEHDLLDRDLRLWAEECDGMQGLQIVTGADDAWGGFAARYVERIRDEYGKVGIWVWGIEGGEREGRKEKQALRAVNAARALQDIASQASLYIPISNVPPRLPGYVSLDRSSQWQTSALLAAAVESVTLPSRMRSDTQQNALLHDLEAALNINGNQRIAQLRCSVLDPHPPIDEKVGQNNLSNQDERKQNSSTSHKLLREDSAVEANSNSSYLDIDMFANGINAKSSQNVGSKDKTHVFGTIDCLRARFSRVEQSEDAEDDGYTRKKRRLAGLPMLKMYRSALEYPLLDTFPDIFPGISSQLRSIAVRSSLSTTSGVAQRVKVLQKAVCCMVGLDDREATSNGLGEIAEAYQEGWDSGSEEDSDD